MGALLGRCGWLDRHARGAKGRARASADSGCASNGRWPWQSCVSMLILSVATPFHIFDILIKCSDFLNANIVNFENLSQVYELS